MVAGNGFAGMVHLGYYLVTGDKSGLLSLACHRGTQIVSARNFSELFA
jgi:hypothetical protein